MDSLCVICGQPEADHHPFQSHPGRPAVCQCDPGTWGDPDDIQPVCELYTGNGVEHCLCCEHDQACHVWEGYMRGDKPSEDL